MSTKIAAKMAQIIRAAELYYERNLSQQEVAKILATSRTTISRLLAEAREQGIVNISINRPVEKHPVLSETLRLQFNLRDAVVVNSGAEYETTLHNVGQAAAELLLSILEDDFTIGISWGRTLSHTVRSLTETTTSGVEIIQMLGSLGEGDPQIDGPDLARRLAEKLGGNYRYVHAPAVVENIDLRDQLMQQAQIRRTLERTAQADICLLSVGALADDESSLQRTGYLSALEREEYLEQGAVGHLLAKMIDIEGNEIPSYNRRVVAIPFRYLQQAAWSIGISASAMKAATVLGAIRGGYINTLVMDEAGAVELLRLADL